MVVKCDICGFTIEPNARFCGGCNVDLKEPKDDESMKVTTEKPQGGKKQINSSPKKEVSEREKVINWCAIRALCNSCEMSFPLYFNLVVILARGEKKLGFCHCSACNQGYREMLASITNATENKKLTAQSREIVIKARGDKIDGLKFDLSEFIGKLNEKEEAPLKHENKDPTPQNTNNRKILIELDEAIITNTILKVLSSDAGQKIIKEASVRRKKSI